MPTPPQTCIFTGNADMYGLGIRVGYYLQWYGLLLSTWLCPSEAPSLRLTNTFFVASTFLALLTQVRKAPTAGLEVVEIYITLLFTFGSSLSLLPVLVWRTVSRCDPWRDPSRFPRARQNGGVYNVLNNFLLMAVLGFQVWFWAVKVPTLNQRACAQYGFLFRRVTLQSSGIRVLHLVFAGLLLVLIAGYTLLPQEREKKNLRGGGERRKRLVLIFQIFDTFSKFITATLVVLATELSIHWNAISGINGVDSAGQLIPLVIGIGTVTRVLYLAFKNKGKNQDSKEYGKPGERWHTGQFMGPTRSHVVPTSGLEPEDLAAMPVYGISERWHMPDKSGEVELVSGSVPTRMEID